MSVRERPPQELRSIKSLPMVVGHECMSNVSTMLDNFQTTSMQHLRSLIGERMRHTAPLEAKETPEFVMNEKNRKLLQTKNVSDIEKFLSKADARTSQDFPLYMISDQIAKICSAQSSYGLSLCFASYIKSFAVLCDFLLHEESWKEGKKDKKLANHAIDILLKSKLPPLFYPDVNSRVLMQVDFGDITPVCPTAITSTESMLYVGCPGPVIKAIPLSRTQKQEVTNIEIPELPDKRYSLVTHNGVLILSSSKEPPLHIDPNEKVFMKLQVSHYGHRPMVVPKFGPPVVTDGEFFYSIAYSEAKVKTFKLEMDGIFFVSAVKLTAQKDELMEPFKEILPPGQKKKCSIATNGIYIAFLFRREGITICRIFLLRNGAHHQDVVLNGVDDIDSWCFDGFRPAHCILRKGRAVFLDGQYTLPKWLVGFTEPPENPKVTTGKPDDIISAVSQAMAIFISRVLGTEVPLPINMHNQYYKNSMEKCICKFIDQDNRYAAQSLIALLGLKMIRGDTDLSPEDFIRRLFECYDDPKYEYLHRQIVFTVVSSLDTFFQACPEFTSKVLLRVLNSKEYINISCKYLPRSQFLLNALTAESLTRLCDMTLKTTYMFDEESISLLKEIQYSFVAKGNFDSQLMCILYVGKLCDQLTDDYSHVLNDDWTPQRFATTVSFILFHELVQLVRAVCDSQPLNLELARRLFVVGSLPHPVLSPETEAICKTFTQALFVSIMLYVNHIKNDTNFYALPSTMNGRNRNTEKVGCEFPTGACGISESLSQAICRTVSLACCENVLKDEIVDAIHSVFQLVVSGDVTEEEVIDRCHCIDAIQPQLFRNVIRFLTEGGRCHVVEDPNQCCSVQLLSNLEQPFSETMKATLAYFLDDLYDVRQHFVILPPEYLSKFIQAFDLRFNLPICWFPVDLRINAKWIADMSFDMLVSCFDNVLALASRIENVELLHKTEIVSSEIYNSAIREDLIRKLMILRIAIKHDLSAPMPSHHIFIQCVQIGDYEVVYQVIEIMKVLLASEKYNGLELVMFLFKCIGGFLSGESNIFLVQR